MPSTDAPDEPRAVGSGRTPSWPAAVAAPMAVGALGLGWLAGHSGAVGAGALVAVAVGAVLGHTGDTRRLRAWSAVAALAATAGAMAGTSSSRTTGTWLAAGAAGVLAAVLAVWVGSTLAAARRAGERADERSRALDQFRQDIVTTVSHELRTPLTVIQGVSSVLHAKWDGLAETQKLDLIDCIADNVASLDSSILHFADAGRLVRGEYQLEAELIALRPVVDRVRAKLDGVLAGHEVVVGVPDETVWADAEALGRILELLLANAARFAPLASQITVRASLAADGGLDLSVADRGPGIPATQMPHIWEPFWRADVRDSGVSRGAGLGLFIVKELAQRHGGDVRAASARNRGTTITVTLPGPPAEVWAARQVERQRQAEQVAARPVTPRRPVPAAARPTRPGRVRGAQVRAAAARRPAG